MSTTTEPKPEEVDDMPGTAEGRNKARRAVTLLVAGAHAALVALRFGNWLHYTVPSTEPVLQAIAESDLWLWLHALVAIAIIFAVRARRYLVDVMSASCGVMWAWSFLMLLWGLTPVRPVSLTGPVLGLVFAGVSYHLARSYAEGAHRAEGK